LACYIVDADVDALGDLGDASVARRAEKVCAQGRGGDGPAQGVFAAAAAYHQYAHGLNLLKYRLFLTI
jgi:hypothetical protein